MGLLGDFLVFASLQVECSMLAINWIKLKIAGVLKITTLLLSLFLVVLLICCNIFTSLNTEVNKLGWAQGCLKSENLQIGCTHCMVLRSYRICVLLVCEEEVLQT